MQSGGQVASAHQGVQREDVGEIQIQMRGEHALVDFSPRLSLSSQSAMLNLASLPLDLSPLSIIAFGLISRIMTLRSGAVVSNYAHTTTTTITKHMLVNHPSRLAARSGY